MPSAAASSAARHGAVDREAGDAGERGDRLGEVAALADEDRPDQVGGGEARLGDHVADPGGPAQPARAGQREGGDRGHAPGVGTRCGRPQAFTMPGVRRLTPAGRCRRVMGTGRGPAEAWTALFQYLRRGELPEPLVLGAARRRLDARLLSHARGAARHAAPGAAAAGGGRRGSTSWRISPASGSAASTTALGVPLAALAGFVLAGVFALGFLSGIETAQAAFAILLPLAVIVYSKLRLALAVRRKRHGRAGAGAGAGAAADLAPVHRRRGDARRGGGGGGAASADPAALTRGFARARKWSSVLD